MGYSLFRLFFQVFQWFTGVKHTFLVVFLDARKKIVLGLIIVSTFIFLVTVLVFVYVLSTKGEDVPDLFRPFIQHHVHFMVLMGFFGVFSGVVVYSILNSTIEKQKKLVKTNMGIIMKFLGPDDRQAMRVLLEKGGSTTQSEIASHNGMTRLKAHRIVRRLEDRGVIHVEKHGKLNIVRLVDELKDIDK